MGIATSYDTVLRFRTTADFKHRIEAILKARGHGDLSEFIREVLTQRVEEEEARLRLRPETARSRKSATSKMDIERLAAALEQFNAAQELAAKKKQAARKRAA